MATPGDDAAADLQAVVALRPELLAPGGQGVRLPTGDGFAWDGGRVRLEVALAPLQAAGLIPERVAGWQVVAPEQGRPALLVRELTLR